MTPVGAATTVSREAITEYGVRWWVPGDWNAFFGLFTNVVLNVIVLTGLTLGVVKLPADVVFGRILGMPVAPGERRSERIAFTRSRSADKSADGHWQAADAVDDALGAVCEGHEPRWHLSG